MREMRKEEIEKKEIRQEIKKIRQNKNKQLIL